MSASHFLPSSAVESASGTHRAALAAADGEALLSTIRQEAATLGFGSIGVADVDLRSAEPGLLAWLAQGFHGDMHYMAAHGLKRARPAELVPGTVRVITARMDYLPAATPADWRQREQQRLLQPGEAVVSVYARGRDYHKIMRARLQQLAGCIEQHVGGMGYRVFTDSAPVLEAELARRSAQGWRGKHTLLLNREAGSTFFLGEIFTDLPLPVTPPLAHNSYCGQCTACITACPTQAIIAPYRLDARRCISYLTIEHHGAIAPELRPLIGNRIYGCDDCQLACPWNKFARRSHLPDFDERNDWGSATLLQLWQWDEATFLRRTEGSPIRRIGHVRWLRNLAVALGNALRQAAQQGDAQQTQAIQQALQQQAQHPEDLVREHVAWAQAQGEDQRQVQK